MDWLYSLLGFNWKKSEYTDLEKKWLINVEDRTENVSELDNNPDKILYKLIEVLNKPKNRHKAINVFLYQIPQRAIDELIEKLEKQLQSVAGKEKVLIQEQLNMIKSTESNDDSIICMARIRFIQGRYYFCIQPVLKKKINTGLAVKHAMTHTRVRGNFFVKDPLREESINLELTKLYANNFSSSLVVFPDLIDATFYKYYKNIQSNNLQTFISKVAKFLSIRYCIFAVNVNSYELNKIKLDDLDPSVLQELNFLRMNEWYGSDPYETLTHITLQNDTNNFNIPHHTKPQLYNFSIITIEFDNNHKKYKKQDYNITRGDMYEFPIYFTETKRFDRVYFNIENPKVTMYYNNYDCISDTTKWLNTYKKQNLSEFDYRVSRKEKEMIRDIRNKLDLNNLNIIN